MSLQLEESTRYLNLGGGNQHYWLKWLSWWCESRGALETPEPRSLGREQQQQRCSVLY